MSNTDFGDIEVFFPSTGVRILPYGVDYRVQQQKLEYSKLEVSREAGELIAETIRDDPIPVILSVNGSALCRLCADEEAVTHVGDISWISLSDPRAVLENGNVQWEPERTTLGNAVEYVFDRVEDPHGVLTGVRFIGEVDREETRRQYENNFQKWADPKYPDRLKDMKNPLSGKPILYTERLAGGFRFRGVTPFEAIQEIQSTFAVNSWVTADGVLTFGTPGEAAQVGIVGEDGGDLRLADHHIVEQAVPVSAIQAAGSHTGTEWGYGTVTYNSDLGNISIRAVARISQDSRSRILELAPLNVSGIKELEQIAINELRSRISESVAGTLTINSAVSGNSELAPQDIDLGDILMVPEIDRDCHKAVRAGIYVVRGLNHRVSAQAGWTTTIDVSKFVPESGVSVSSTVSEVGSEDWVDSDQYLKEISDER